MIAETWNYFIYIYVYECIYIYIYLYKYITYIYIYIHTYIHIYIHIYSCVCFKNCMYFTKKEFLWLFQKILLMTYNMCTLRKVKRKVSFFCQLPLQRKPCLPSATIGFLSSFSDAVNPNIIAKAKLETYSKQTVVTERF